MTERREEWRAIFTRPASFLDKEYTGGPAFVTERTRPYPTQEDAQYAVLRRSAESHAVIEGFEIRYITATPWVRKD